MTEHICAHANFVVRYKVDLTDMASPESVCTYSLFKAMEYNLSTPLAELGRLCWLSTEVVLKLLLARWIVTEKALMIHRRSICC